MSADARRLISRAVCAPNPGLRLVHAVEIPAIAFTGLVHARLRMREV